jgi:hypothetical protein
MIYPFFYLSSLGEGENPVAINAFALPRAMDADFS